MKRIVLLLFSLSIFFSVNAQQKGSVSISGYVFEQDGSTIISGANVSATSADNNYEEITNEEGYYEFDGIEVGGLGTEYTFIADANGFIADTIVKNLNNPIEIDFSLESGTIQDTVTLSNLSYGNVMYVELELQLNGDSITTKSPDESGSYIFDYLELGNYVIRASLENFDTVWEPIVIENSDTIHKPITMSLTPGYISGYISMDPMLLVTGVSVILDDSFIIKPDMITGFYEFETVEVGNHTVKALFDGYYSDPINYNLDIGPNDAIIEQNFVLYKIPLISLNVLGFDDTFFAIIDNYSLNSSFNVQGEYLRETLVVSLNSPFEISLSESSDYSQEIKLNPESSQIDTTIFVRFKPSESIEYNDTIFLTTDHAETKQVLVKGYGLEQMQAEIISSEDTVCPSENTSLEVINITGGLAGTYTYLWNNGSTESAISVAPTTDTEYSLTVTDALGNTVEANKIIQVYGEPLVFIAPINDSICAGENASFNIVLEEDEKVSYKWMLDGETLEDGDIYSGIDTKELIINATNVEMNHYVYKCQFTRCTIDYYEEAQLIVYSLPVDTIIAKGNPPVVLISPDSGKIYQWYKDEEPIEGETGQFYHLRDKFPKEGIYYVEITNEVTMCSIITEPYKIHTQKSDLVFYPNPVVNQLVVDASRFESNSNLIILITDLAGRELMISEINSQNKKAILQFDSLKNGVYIIRIVDADGMQKYSSKIIKTTYKR